MKIKINDIEYEFGKLTRGKEKIYNEAYKKIEDNSKKNKNTDEEDYDLMVNTLVKLYDNQFTEDDVNDNLETPDIMGAFMNILLYKQSKLNKYLEDSKKDFTKGK